jgi:hypothetical protein
MTDSRYGQIRKISYGAVFDQLDRQVSGHVWNIVWDHCIQQQQRWIQDPILENLHRALDPPPRL